MSRSRWLVFLLPVILLAACGQVLAQPASTCPPGGLAIYLIAEALSGADILQADLSRLRLEQPAVISNDEIIAYLQDTRELQLAPPAVQRLSALKVPMNGRAFVACAEGRPLFGGAFWSYLSSLSYEGLAIMQPMQGMDTAHLETGQPGCPFAVEHDMANGCGLEQGIRKLFWRDLLRDPRVLVVLRREEELK